MLVAYFTDADLLTATRRGLAAAVWQRLSEAPITSRGCAGASEPSIAFRYPAHTVARFGACEKRLCAGDAAMAVDPLCGRGVTDALTSGARAARTVIAAGNGDGHAMSNYHGWLEDRFRTYLTERHALYAREQRWPDSPFWRRRHAVPNGSLVPSASAA